MQVSNATNIPASTAKASTATSKNQSPAFEKNQKAFSTATANAMGAMDAAGTPAKSPSATGNATKSTVSNTVALADESSKDSKATHNRTTSGLSQVNGSAVNAAAGYTQTGLSAGTPTINTSA